MFPLGCSLEFKLAWPLSQIFWFVTELSVALILMGNGHNFLTFCPLPLNRWKLERYLTKCRCLQQLIQLFGLFFQRHWNWDVISVILHPEIGHEDCSGFSFLAMGENQGEINCESLPL